MVSRLVKIVFALAILLQVFAINAASLQADDRRMVEAPGKIAVQLQASANGWMTRKYNAFDYVIHSNDSFVVFNILPEKKKGEEYRMLKPRKQKADQASGWRYRYDLRVLYRTVHSGKQSVLPPALSYVVGGKEQYRIHFTEETIQVQAPPAYLPPYILMGQLQLQSSLSQAFSWWRPLQTGQVYYWHIELSGENIAADFLPEIQQQIQTSSAIKFLPADVQYDTRIQHDRLVQVARLSIPFIVRDSGLSDWPHIRIHYFDTVQQKLRSHQFEFDSVFVLNRYVWWMSLLLVAWFVFKGLRRTLPVLVDTVRRIHRLTRLHSEIARCESAEGMRSSLLAVGHQFGWQENITNHQWQRLWLQQIARQPQLGQAVSSLSAALYGRQPIQAFNELQALVRANRFSQYRACFRASLA